MRQSTNSFLKVVSSLCVLCILCGLISFSAKAQVRPVYDYGAIGLGQLLKRLNTTKSVMHIGAHPDDEDSGLLAYLARGENARTAYLSLTRGDGGQNIIGAELSESLGVIRTEELLQARRLDGAEQFFTRAYDYGFSKTLDEAKQKWDEKIILCDAVRVIRAFRPLVVISRFSGTPADGHGQHQFSGYIAPLAVKAAADSNQCTDAGAAWQVLKFYVGQGFRSTAEPSLKINTGEYDFSLGRSYFEIAMEGRSQHKTQEQGVLELRGERFSGLNLIESKVPKIENEKSIFDGIDTMLKNFSIVANQNKHTQFQKAVKDALLHNQSEDKHKLLQSLLSAYEVIGNSFLRIPQTFNSGEYVLLSRERELTNAIKLASGIQIDALADKETLAPDESFQTTVKIFFPYNQNIKVKEISWDIGKGWQVTKTDAPKENAQIFRRETANETNYFNLKVPREARATQPYWLEKEKIGSLFQWQTDDNQNLPFHQPLVSAIVKIEINGTEITLKQPVEYRFADDIRGEIRRNLNVVPKISLSLDQKLLVIPQSEKAQTRRIVLSVTNNSSAATSGEAKLNVPNGWKITPSVASFNFKNKGEKTSAAFDVTIPARFKIGDFELSAEASAGGETFTQEMNIIAYPHIQTHRFYTDTKTRILVLNLKVEPRKIGYIIGSGDAVPEAIRQMGLSVELLNEMDLTNGDLSRFDVIVVGIRASQVRQDFVSSNQRLLDFVKKGGTMIVQYQRSEYENLLPFPAKIGARVADENAKVTVLDAQNPIFNFPNKITDADFTGWVQERNLYAFTTFEQNYKPLLEAHDAGEAENKGGLVVAEIGKGKYIYCSYAFFRQLPAGVPGAYRIFANLMSLK